MVTVLNVSFLPGPLPPTIPNQSTPICVVATTREFQSRSSLARTLRSHSLRRRPVQACISRCGRAARAWTARGSAAGRPHRGGMGLRAPADADRADTGVAEPGSVIVPGHCDRCPPDRIQDLMVHSLAEWSEICVVLLVIQTGVILNSLALKIFHSYTQSLTRSLQRTLHLSLPPSVPPSPLQRPRPRWW